MCDGHTVYQGEPLNVPGHFNKIGIEFPHFTNPADIAMKILSISYPKEQKDEDFITSVVDLYEKE